MFSSEMLVHLLSTFRVRQISNRVSRVLDHKRFRHNCVQPPKSLPLPLFRFRQLEQTQKVLCTAVETNQVFATIFIDVFVSLNSYISIQMCAKSTGIPTSKFLRCAYPREDSPKQCVCSLSQKLKALVWMEVETKLDFQDKSV